MVLRERLCMRKREKKQLLLCLFKNKNLYLKQELFRENPKKLLSDSICTSSIRLRDHGWIATDELQNSLATKIARSLVFGPFPIGR